MKTYNETEITHNNISDYRVIYQYRQGVHTWYGVIK